MRTLALKPAVFFARTVKCLHIGNLDELELISLFTTCSGVTELGWWLSKLTPNVILALANLPLQRLSIDNSFDVLFPGLQSAPFFSTLTHLDIAFPQHVWTHKLPPLHLFPALTHVCTSHVQRPPQNWCTDIVKACRHLKVLLIISDDFYYDHISLRSHNTDPHIVALPQSTGDWTARWVHDSWPLAEDIVQERLELAAGEWNIGGRGVMLIDDVADKAVNAPSC
jgi:hypothetical protein